jgi:hypothetical protein
LPRTVGDDWQPDERQRKKKCEPGALKSGGLGGGAPGPCRRGLHAGFNGTRLIWFHAAWLWSNFFCNGLERTPFSGIALPMVMG